MSRFNVKYVDIILRVKGDPCKYFLLDYIGQLHLLIVLCHHCQLKISKLCVDVYSET